MALKKRRDLSEDFLLLEIFGGRCPNPKCHRAWASTIHELEPRARGEQSMRRTNRTPICKECHEEFHRKGASEKNINAWKAIIEAYLKAIGNWERYVDTEN